MAVNPPRQATCYGQHSVMTSGKATAVLIEDGVVNLPS